MKLIAILIGKIVLKIGHIFHRGSSLPGKIALKIDKKILQKFKYPPIRIAVTGSSGKGSTSSLIANVLKDNNYSVCYNNAGSNLAWGITTSFIKSCNMLGKIKKDALVMEIDERYAKEIFKYILPTHILITNITKDQPPRQYYIDAIYNDILESINPEAKLILNMDEPYLRNFEKDTSNEIIYYSLAKNKYSYKLNIFENLNTYYCINCHSLLKYDYYNFETLGRYKCPQCAFKYQTPQVVGKNIDLEKETLEINNDIINIGGNMLYNAYNTIAAYTLLNDLNIKKSQVIKSINEINIYHTNEFIYDQKTYFYMSTKAENATTYNSAIFKTLDNHELKDIIIGWKEISRRYNHYDISWLYDIEFELLNNKSLNNIYACGIDKENIKKRLLLAGISEEKIITANNIEEIKDQVKDSRASFVIGILNFDYVDAFINNFKEDNNEN